MRVWREVRFPTVSNSILQTVRKHAAAPQSLGTCAAYMSVFFFALHNETLSSLNESKVGWRMPLFHQCSSTRNMSSIVSIFLKGW